MAAQQSIARVGARPGAARQGWFKASQRVLGRDWPIAWLFFLPTALLLFGLIGYPFVSAVYLSLFNVVGTRQGNFVGLQNYINLWRDEFFVRSVWTTVSFTFWSEIFKFSIGLCAALLLHNLPKWAAILGGIALLPYIIPEVVRALAWRVVLDPLFGGLNYILIALHLVDKGPSWLGDPSTALASVITVNVWSGIPFFIILLLAGLKAVDHELYDAAAVDGANAWRRFLHVTLPGLRYVIIVATLLSTIFTFNNFTLTYLMTGGGPGGATRVYSILAFEYAVRGLRFSAGVSVAMTMAPFLFVLILFLGRYMMRREDMAHASDEDGAVWHAAMIILWPVRLLLRGIVAAFWAINSVAESVFGAANRAIQTHAPERQTHRADHRVRNTIMYALIAILLVFELFPFYFIFVTAFKSTLQIQQIQDMFWPNPWSLEHFMYLFTQLPFVNWYANTILVAVVSTLVSMFAASLAAYALVRLRWRGVGPLSTSVLVAYLMPGALMFIPLYGILTQLKLINTQAALMVTYPTIVLPFAIWLMMGYYRSLPEELEDAAMIDGCNRFQTYWMVVLPLVRPALLAVAMFSITQAWNEFLYAYTFLRSSEVFTLPVGLGQLIVGDVQPWGELMAAALLTALPVIIIYMVGQRFMVAGLTAGVGERIMPKRINKALELLEQQQAIYYTSSEHGRGYEAGRAMAGTWADYVNYEMEHGPFDVGALLDFMRGLADGGPTASGHRTPAVIVTLPVTGADEQYFRHNEWMVSQVLATGVHGILLCHAESPGAIAAFVEASRYVFRGGRRGSGGQAQAAAIWGIPMDEYLKRADPWPLNPDGELLLGVKIENTRALANAEAVTAVPGISFAEWGPGDMGMSMGFADAHDPPYPPEMQRARDRILAACKANNLAFLEMVTPDNVVEQLGAGVMIGAGRHAEAAAAIGRRHSNRPEPW